MKRFKYVFYRYWQRKVDEYSSFEDALHNYVFDLNYGESYGIGIYDQESKALYLPDFFNKEHRNRSIKEIEKLGYEIKEIKTFEVQESK